MEYISKLLLSLLLCDVLDLACSEDWRTTTRQTPTGNSTSTTPQLIYTHSLTHPHALMLIHRAYTEHAYSNREGERADRAMRLTCRTGFRLAGDNDKMNGG